METLEEKERNSTVAESLCNLGGYLIDLRNELVSVGVPLKDIEISNWPEFDKDNITIKLWDGNDYTKGIGRPNGNNLTREDIIAIIKRRQILKRKF